jgi:hypothetical protein
MSIDMDCDEVLSLALFLSIFKSNPLRMVETNNYYRNHISTFIWPSKCIGMRKGRTHSQNTLMLVSKTNKNIIITANHKMS